MSTGDDDNHGDPPLPPPQPEEEDAGYGDVTVGGELFSVPGYDWADVAALGPDVAGRAVRVRGAAHAVRAVGRRVAFLVLRQGSSTVQCVVGGGDGGYAGMARFAAGLSRESVVDVAGVVSLPREPVRATTQQEVEIQVKKLYCISRATPNLPISVDDAARSEEDVAKAKAAGEQLVHVGQDKRLDFRVIDLRTPANQAIFRVQCEIENIFRQVLLSEGFVGIHTPKLIGGSSEGGAAVFKLDYNGQPACLAQSPQLHKQMAICGGFERVFEVGPVFRAEDSNTHRHLCEFVGLDMEMAIKDHYFEVCDVVDRLFVAMFDHLNKNCAKELEAINRQYPFKPLKETNRSTTSQSLWQMVSASKLLRPGGLLIDVIALCKSLLYRRINRKWGLILAVLTQDTAH
uniref:aspartate--tRNA ligase n=1 Tax=Oryza punctata TaxID=4537 RepID=A0A0E0JVD1_ORYPU